MLFKHLQVLSMLTLLQLYALVEYDPLSGHFRCLRTRLRMGTNRGGSRKDGHYWGISVAGATYYAHRLAWFYMTGQWPEHQIDHRDMDRQNNRWSNLRKATQREQLMNRKSPKHNKTGLKGVCFHKASGLYGARIRLDGVQRSLGYYRCPAAAHFAYVVEADKVFGEFARFDGARS